MKMIITPGWLRNKIETAPDTEIEAGIPVMMLESIGMFLPRESAEEPAEDERLVRLKHAFGVFIRNLRLTRELPVEALAECAHIDATELYAIENDPHYVTKPRTVYQLANFFGINLKKMMELSGATQTYDESLEEEALKFAAKSDGVSSLNKEEHEILNEYVKFLNEH